MNSNLAKVGKPTRWPPGKSGNPAGKPPGTRTAFSQGFIRDFALVWAEEGLEAVRKVRRRVLRPLWRSQLAFVPTMSGSRLSKPFLVE
jgi:hypothetical protein